MCYQNDTVLLLSSEVFKKSRVVLHLTSLWGSLYDCIDGRFSAVTTEELI